jgi:SAM-dependent methyltransferase
MTDDADYVLGTGDDEVARLGLQHLVWRSYAMAAWLRAGFTAGQTLLDIGCGPGHASVELAEIVGTSGRVLAIDRSRRFLEALEATRRARGLPQLATHELDLEHADLPRVGADGAWCRWVLSFVKQPRALLAQIGGALRQGGVLVLHEYFDYGTWRMMPGSREVEEFVAVVMDSWRAEGGEPDIGLQLPLWLAESGFEVKTVRPIIDVVPPSNLLWQWPKTFLHSNLSRLVQLGYLTPERAGNMAQAFAACEAAPHTLMITPGVLEIVAIHP